MNNNSFRHAKLLTVCETYIIMSLAMYRGNLNVYPLSLNFGKDETISYQTWICLLHRVSLCRLAIAPGFRVSSKTGNCRKYFGVIIPVMCRVYQWNLFYLANGQLSYVPSVKPLNSGINSLRPWYLGHLFSCRNSGSGVEWRCSRLHGIFKFRADDGIAERPGECSGNSAV
jgi:hypothetical protein